MKTCSIEGCGRPHDAKGYCTAHWKRWRKYGEPLAGSTPKGELPRFIKEVVLPYEGDDCLIWPFDSKDRHGYAQAKVNGRMISVHRLVCQEVHGDQPSPDLDAAHSCGQGHLGCVNPRHLSWKTRAENEADKLIHGTAARGERGSSAKLTEEEVLRIRTMRGRLPQHEIAGMFGVSREAVSAIHRRRSWGWLE